METMEPKVSPGGRNLEAILMYGLFPYYRLYFFSTMVQIVDQYQGQIFIINLKFFLIYYLLHLWYLGFSSMFFKL